jgi:hypothetical protein
VAGKNGTVPEVGERNMENLPAAIGSIKSASDIPKIKVSSFTVTNDCLNEDGRWEGDVLIDTSELTTLGASFSKVNITLLDTTNWNLSKLTSAVYCFRNCKNLKKIIGVENWDMSSADAIHGMFYASGLEELDVSKWDIHASRYDEMFVNMKSIKKLDLTSWDFSRCTGILYFMTGCSLLETIVGDYSLNDVISNEISVLKGCKVGATYMFENTPLNTASLRAIVNGIADVTDKPAASRPTLKLGTASIAKLEREDPDSIVIATEKGWNLA